MSQPRRRPPISSSRLPKTQSPLPLPAGPSRIRPLVWTVGLGIIAVAGAYGGALFKHEQDQKKVVKEFQQEPIEDRIAQLENIRKRLEVEKKKFEKDLMKAKMKAAKEMEGGRGG
ncbi:hypothetical protein P152DRAFT_477495 [Eremomyces bilateralis CBS 781.70]|uniref:Uncharacterized protein n=1 Tax=Eremomyces bilateralis CBS 781.70 TaxID=1392243 RepID=A0A6G1FRF6_9PEZI|nr:uncharacterized protein P152DRAFT_477495 [Eremomyces bilateralis CBS 781.70]KAF1808269.1 hypothetical protein P152DRAFT_477495 [Eremomyces bilateralis CBS 781.70]